MDQYQGPRIQGRQLTARPSYFEQFAAKMRAAGQPELAIDIFHFYYDRLLAGATGYIDRREALPVRALPSYEELSKRYETAGADALDRTVILKLNGGLGTSMGMSGPKSLLPVKGELTFLDVIVRQTLHMRRTAGIRLPLVLMNSVSTRPATEAALARYSDFRQDIPVDFVQHWKPKIDKKTLQPAAWPADPEKEWCPPGHGDIYVSLITSGMLDAMLNAGYEYLFVSNSDNLGALLDTRILGYLAAERIPFLMEVANRTLADNKGGHLSVRPDGQLILRELSQCPPEEREMFQDINRYRYFNTNNLWLHLPTVYEVMRRRGGKLELPLIRNEKTVDPTDPESPRVYQLETAMGSAIALFEGAQALRVPRMRFVPVKKNNDLLVLWSDVYELTEECHLRLSPARHTYPLHRPPLVKLDDRYYGMIDDLRRRFPHGAPSLIECTSLTVEGDVRFGRNVAIRGAVRLVNDGAGPLVIEDGAVITDG
jgi:UTP--glucose-1-phosphate uridylyltransferase